MKKHPFLFILVMLILASLACNFPFQRPAADDQPVHGPLPGFREESRVVDQDLITLAVPESYYVGSSVTELTDLVEGLGVVPVSLDNLSGYAGADILMWGYDEGSAAVVPTSFVVIKNKDYAFMPLDLLSTLVGVLLGNNVEILQENRLTIAGRDTLRWITLTRQAGLELTQAVYVFKNSGVIYLIGFNADQQEVSAQLDNYDAIVASLRIEDLE
ncbi:MAG: hypothetical protein WCY93_09530 [Anaerolineaceae bacterium]